MKIISRICACALAVFCALQASCQKSQDGASDIRGNSTAFVADPACKQELEALDFSSHLAQLAAQSNALKPDGYLSAIRPENMNVEPGDPALTESEKLVLDGTNFMARDPNESADTAPSHRCRMAVGNIVYWIEDFARQVGREPQDGAELLLFIHPELNTPEGVAELKRLSWEEQLLKIGYQINFITGRTYGPFGNMKWSPGGIYTRYATSEEIGRNDPFLVEVFKSLTEPQPKSRVAYYFGEREDVVLAQEVHTRVPNNSGYFNHPGITLPEGAPTPNNPCGSHTDNPCNPCNPCAHP